MGSPLLECRDVVKWYGAKSTAKKVLSGVSLKLFKGEVVALVGPNDAGKSTLSEIIASLHPLNSGDIFFHGTSIYDDIMAYRRAIGFCPQAVSLHADLNVEEHLYYAFRYYSMDTVAIKARVEDVLRQFALTPYRTQSPANLSSGFRQRLVLARALVHKPQLIILDEPTIGLDLQSRRQLWQKIARLRDQGVAFLLVTHYLDEVEFLANRIVFLDKGLVRIVATPQELKNNFKKNRLEDVFMDLLDQSEFLNIKK